MKSNITKRGFIFNGFFSILFIMLIFANLSFGQQSRGVAWGISSGTFNYGQAVFPQNSGSIIGISAGWLHSVALKADRTVIAWGDNSNNQCSVPTNLSSIVGIAAGGFHTSVLKSDGTVVSWGWNPNGQLNIPSGLSSVIGIAAGGFNTLALKSNGTVVSWGEGFGGVGNSGQTIIPVGLASVVGIAVGWLHSVALKSDGTIVVWGNNTYGQCNVPSNIGFVIGIAAGGNHTLALKADGTVIAWGRNTEGQTNVPNGLVSVVGISAGGGDATLYGGGTNPYYAHSLALKSDGTIVAWGRSTEGQTTIPPNLEKVTKIASGGAHNLVIEYYKNTQTILGLNSTLLTKYGNTNISLSSITATSGLPISFISNNVSVASINGSNIIIKGSGIATITGLQVGNISYKSANPVFMVLTITKANLTVQGNNFSREYGSGNPIFTGSVLGVVNNDIINPIFTTLATSLSGVGNYIILATATGSNIANYNLLINNSTLTITKSILTISSPILFNSNLYDGNPKVASILGLSSIFGINYTYNGNTTAPINAGTYTVVGIVSDLNYTGTVTSTIVINKATQSIVGMGATATATIGGTNITLTGIASSGLEINYNSTNSATGSISGNQLLPISVGVVTVTASQIGNINFEPATNQYQIINIVAAPKPLTNLQKHNAEQINHFIIYPNPLNGVECKVENAEIGEILYLFNSQGLLVLTQNIVSDITIINKKLASGIYFVKIGIQISKLIVF